VVATIVLGLGIDLLDIQLVLHVDILYEFDDYRQESEQAGQDRQTLEAIILIKSL